MKFFKISFLILLFLSVSSFGNSFVEQNLDYSDHLQALSNPGRGVTHHKGFYLSPGRELNLKTNGTVYNDFMRFLIDLGGFSSNAWTYEKDASGTNVKVSRGKSAPLDEVSLNNIRLALDSLRRRGGTCTIRASYDIDCRGSQDPDVETTLIHTKQLAELYSDYEDVIHYVELGMFGTCGEMTSGGQENHVKALQTFLENSSDGIRVGVRSPQVVALWMGLKDPYNTWYIYPDFRADSERFKDSARVRGKFMERVGLYNDGYLGSDNDLGTFGAGDPKPISRENVISWLEEYGVNVPYGGDFVYNYNSSARPPLNTAEYMSYEGFRTHTSYIGGSMSGEKYHWMDTTLFKGTDKEYAMKKTGKEYLTDHFGYRFVLRNSKVMDSVGIGGEFRAELKIQNVGFGNNLMVKKATLILRNLSEDSILELPLDFDPTKILSRKLKMKTSDPTGTWNGSNFNDLYEEKDEFDGINSVLLSAILPKTMAQGKWRAYLRFSQYGDFLTDKNYHCIQFANDSAYFDKETASNYIGEFELSDKIVSLISSKNGLANASIRVLGKDLIFENVEQAEIFDLKGNKLLEKNFSDGKSNAISLETLPRGALLVRARGASPFVKMISNR